jgi:hypothetical protein
MRAQRAQCASGRRDGRPALSAFRERWLGGPFCRPRLSYNVVMRSVCFWAEPWVRHRRARGRRARRCAGRRSLLLRHPCSCGSSLLRPCLNSTAVPAGSCPHPPPPAARTPLASGLRAGGSEGEASPSSSLPDSLPVAGPDTDWRAYRARLAAMEAAAAPSGSSGPAATFQDGRWAHTVPQPETGCVLLAHPAMFDVSLILARGGVARSRLMGRLRPKRP